MSTADVTNKESESSSGTSQPPTDETKNPLCNPVVLTRLFQFFTISDVPELRLVSKQWNSILIFRARNKMTVNIRQPTLGELEREPQLQNKLQWRTLHQDLDSGMIPFRFYRLHDLEFVSSPPPTIPPESSRYRQDANEPNNNYIERMYRNMEEFFGMYLYGGCIRKLELSKAVVFSVRAFKQVVFEKMPNLEELVLVGLVTRRELEVEPNEEPRRQAEVVQNEGAAAAGPQEVIPNDAQDEESENDDDEGERVDQAEFEPEDLEANAEADIPAEEDDEMAEINELAMENDVAPEEMFGIVDPEDSEVPPDDGDGVGEVVNVQSNLTSLTLRSVRGFPVTWRHFFSHFPSIQKLELSDLHAGIKLLPIVQGLEQLSRDPNHKIEIADLTLSKLLRSPYDNGSTVKGLLQLPQMKLTSLHIDVGGCDEDDGSVLHTAMQIHDRTLRKLCVTNCWYDGREWDLDVETFNDFPYRFNSVLTELEIKGCAFPNLHFLEKLPNLKTLLICMEGIQTMEGTNLTRMESVRLPHVEKFHFNAKRFPEFYIPGGVMEMLTKVMPNVEYFSGTVLTSAFQAICKNWGKLKELELNSECTDFSGCNLNLKCVDDQGITGVWTGSEEQFPNITNLQCLEKLTIHQTKKIGDASIWNGFLKLPCLQCLNVDLSPETSDSAFEALRKQVPCGKITRLQTDQGEPVPGPSRQN